MRSLLFLCLAALPLLTAQSPTEEPAAPVTVVLVRHAEKSAEGDDPGLTQAGVDRAQHLAELFSESGVTHLFSTEFARTRATLAPLAEATDVELQIVGAREAKHQITLLQALPPGAVAVVAGHSNTTPGLAKALGVTPKDLEEHPRYGGMIPDATYDRIYLITLPTTGATAAKLVELRY